MIAAVLMCASLTAIDGDTVRCDGQLMRLLGGGVPFQWGIDTPEIGSHAKCIKERKLALIAKGRLKELLDERGLRIEIKATTIRRSIGRRAIRTIGTETSGLRVSVLPAALNRLWCCAKSAPTCG